MTELDDLAKEVARLSVGDKIRLALALLEKDRAATAHIVLKAAAGESDILEALVRELRKRTA